MPVYRYKAAGSTGKSVEGVVEATDTTQAVAQIRRNYDVVLSLEQVKEQTEDPLQRMQKLNLKTFALMCKQFAIILRAGLPLVQSVDLVASQISDRMLKKMLAQVSEDVMNGWSLSYSFSQRGKGKLPSTFIETIRSGEESGDLVRTFERMSSYYGRMAKTRSKATGALIYPAFLTAVAVVVVIVIMTYAVPTFSSSFQSMGIELPLTTRIVIGVSNFFSKYIWAILFVLALGLLALRLYAGSENGRMNLDRWRLTIPILGDVSSMASASQFSHTMVAMLSAGMPILKALDIAARAMDNAWLAQQIRNVIPGVESGQLLGDCLTACQDLPPMLVQMIAMGEATGSLESTLAIQAEYFDNEVDTLTARALALLEPVIICVMAVLVVIILLAIYVPIFSMYEAI